MEQEAERKVAGGSAHEIKWDNIKRKHFLADIISMSVFGVPK